MRGHYLHASYSQQLRFKGPNRWSLVGGRAVLFLRAAGSKCRRRVVPDLKILMTLEASFFENQLLIIGLY